MNNFVIEDGVLKEYTGKDKQVIIPEEVTIISGSFHGVFSNNRDVEEIIIPKNVQEIKTYSFRNCENLKNIIVLNDDIKIHDNAFIGCNNLVDETGFFILNKNLIRCNLQEE